MSTPSSGPPSLPAQPSRNGPSLGAEYPGRDTDFRGTPSGALCVYKTGIPFPNPPIGPEAFPYQRELVPVVGHPIQTIWVPFLKTTAVYLAHTVSVNFHTIAGLGVKNAEENQPFCPLIVVIGSDPGTVTLEQAKFALDFVKGDILHRMGFGSIDVALREWVTGPSATTANQSSIPMRALFQPRNFPDFDVIRPFTSVLTLSISPFDFPQYKGTGGFYLRRLRPDDSYEYALVTASHVVRPVKEQTYENIEFRSDGGNDIKVVSLGDAAYGAACDAIATRIKTYEEDTEELPKTIRRLETRLKGLGDTNPKKSAMLSEQMAWDQRRILRAEEQTPLLEDLKANTDTKDGPSSSTLGLEARVIGHVLHADPVGARPPVGEGDPGPTIDWAVVKLIDDEIVEDHFLGNAVYIGDMIRADNIRTMLPCPHEDPATCKLCLPFPPSGLFPMTRVISRSDLKAAAEMKRDTDHGYPVFKHGSSTGTTVGRLNGLLTLTIKRDEDNRREYSDILRFAAMELTALGHEGRAFSKKGDSGAAVADRQGRLIGLLTAGTGSTDSNDLTYMTPIPDLYSRITEVLPGWELCPLVDI